MLIQSTISADINQQL